MNVNKIKLATADVTGSHGERTDEAREWYELGDFDEDGRFAVPPDGLCGFLKWVGCTDADSPSEIANDCKDYFMFVYTRVVLERIAKQEVLPETVVHLWRDDPSYHSLDLECYRFWEEIYRSGDLEHVVMPLLSE